MEPLYTSTAAFLTWVGGPAAAAHDITSSFQTAPSKTGQTASIQASQKQDGPFTPSCSYWHCVYKSCLGQAADVVSTHNSSAGKLITHINSFLSHIPFPQRESCTVDSKSIFI